MHQTRECFTFQWIELAKLVKPIASIPQTPDVPKYLKRKNLKTFSICEHFKFQFLEFIETLNPIASNYKHFTFEFIKFLKILNPIDYFMREFPHTRARIFIIRMLCQQFALQFLNLSLGIYTNFKLHLVKQIKGKHKSNYEYYFLYQRFVHKSENQISRNSQKSQIYDYRINKRPHIEILSRRIP